MFQNPVSNVFGKVWLVLQPMLFGLIGAEIDLNELRIETISSGLCVIFGALVVSCLNIKMYTVVFGLSYSQFFYSHIILKLMNSSSKKCRE